MPDIASRKPRGVDVAVCAPAFGSPLSAVERSAGARKFIPLQIVAHFMQLAEVAERIDQPTAP
jgi:hypothetical protein